MPRFLFALLTTGVFVSLPLVALAAPATFFGPIISETCNCAGRAPNWGCALEALQNSLNFAVSIGVIIVTLVIAYAGILWITSPMNPHNRELGRTMLLNAVIGLVITLSGWLMVDFVMKAIYNEGAAGPWNSILGDDPGPQCFEATPIVGAAPGDGGLEAGTPDEEPEEETPGEEPEPEPGPAPTGDLSGITLSIGANAVVSTSAQNRLKQILRTAGLTSATITSGRRTAADQARIMEQNLNDGNRINYAAAGDAVTAVYDQMKAQGASRANIRAAMEAEINRQGCYNVSKHCTTGDVIDVSPGSISNRPAFESAVRAAGVSRFLRPGEFNETTYHIEF